MSLALSYQNINNHPERVNNINFFIDENDWKEKEFPSHKNDWEKFEKTSSQLLLMYYMFLITLKK